MPRNAPNPRTLFALLLALLLITALAPTNPVTSAATALYGPASALLAPVSGAASWISTRLRPGDQDAAPDRPDAYASDEQFLELRQRWMQAVDEVERLRRQLEALQAVAPYLDEGALRKVVASRVGVDIGAGTIDVRAGTREGVTADAIATAVDNPIQLVGRAVRVGRLVTTIRSFAHADEAPALIEGVIVPEGITNEDLLRDAPRCQLEPRPDGSLVARSVAVGDSDRIEPGHLVHLSDETWPRAAQMLVIGRVVRVEQTEQPLHRRVVVRPRLDPMRVRGVVLRIPQPIEAGGDAP